MMTTGRLARLGTLATQFQGELNETNDVAKGVLSELPTNGPQVIRGVHVCLYCTREASQGDAIYVNVARFGEREKGDSKATHHRQVRAGFQRKSPQNNFRRLIATLIPAGAYLLESVSYVPAHQSKLPLAFVVAVLNSKLAEWYFRLGSTNAQVSEYQFDVLPCPIFAAEKTPADRALFNAAKAALDTRDYAKVLATLDPACQTAPFPRAVRDVIITATERIIAIESARGDIVRTARSALDLAAHPYQDLIDGLFYRLAGLSAVEAAGLESRLAQML